MRHSVIYRSRRNWKKNCTVAKYGRWACWEWKAGKSSDGKKGSRARIYVSGRGVINAAVFAYELFYGPLKHCCLHKCDNSLCVRPTHLYDGTLSQNSKDAWGRHPNKERRRKVATSTLGHAQRLLWADVKHRRKIIKVLRQNSLDIAKRRAAA